MPSDKRFTTAVPGPVVKIRLATTDVMSAIDMAEALGLDRPGMSLAQVCKWGIVGALWRLRQSGELPEHDGFEYANMIARYENNAANRKALAAMSMNGANELALRAARFVAIGDDGDDGADDAAKVRAAVAELVARNPALAAVPRTDAQPGSARFAGRFAGCFTADDERDAAPEDMSTRFTRRPAELRLRMAAVAELNHRVMSTELASERSNLTPRERALWLLNSDSAESWEMFFSLDEFNAAASEVLTYWPAGATEIHALRDQPRASSAGD